MILGFISSNYSFVFKIAVRVKIRCFIGLNKHVKLLVQLHWFNGIRILRLLFWPGIHFQSHL